MRYKHYVSLVLFLSTGLYVLYVSVMVCIDPLQVFHKATDRKDKNLIRGLRFQAAGIINNYPFDSIILGSSIAANFSPNEASNLFGDHFVNISPDGSLLSERSLILNYVLGKKNLKHVIVSLDGFAPIGKYQDDFPVSNFGFLYNKSRLDDLKIYFNLKYAKYAIFKQEMRHAFKTLETIAEWGSIKAHNKRFGGLDKWFESKNNGQIKAAFKEITRSTNCIKNNCQEISSSAHHQLTMFESGPPSFDQYLLKTAKENPEVQLHLFFPPYSRLRYAMWAQESPQVFDIYLSTIKYIVHRSELVSNLHIYGFEDMDFLDDISNYKDPFHYHPKFNSRMLYWMKNEKHELSNKVLDRYLEKIKYRAENYDVISIGNKIEEYLSGP